MSKPLPPSPTAEKTSDSLSPANSPSRFSQSKWRPAMACGGAFLIGYLAMPQLFKVRGAVAETAAPTSAAVVIPASAVMSVRPAKASATQIRGEVKLVANVTGKSPVGGAIARWLVEPGAKVSKGQPVVEISSGQATRPAPTAEIRQTQAEKQQIQAANEQLELAQKMANAQTRLRLAQDRVLRAQEKVGEARTLIRRLQSGDSVSAPSVAPAKIRKKVVKRTVPAKENAPSGEEIRAASALQSARNAAEAAQSAHSRAVAELKGVEKSVASSKSAIKDAEKRLALTETAFEEGKLSGADVHESRVALDEAQSAAKNSEGKIEAAKREVEAKAKLLASANAELETAKQEAARARGARPASQPEIVTEEVVEVEVDAPQAPQRVENSPGISFDGASRMAQRALEESRAATREAEKLTREVASYRAQAHASNLEIEEAAQRLMQAQQKVLDSVPRPQIAVCQAPQNGTVVWISRLATEVGRGDSVFGMAANARYKAQLRVAAPAWKNMKVGQIVPATIGRNSENVSLAPAPAPEVRGATYSPVPIKPMMLNIAITKITPPAENAADKTMALVEGEIQMLSNTEATLSAGEILLATLPLSGKVGALRVPERAIFEENGAHFVATLSPTAGETNASTAPTATAQPLAPQPEGEIYTLRWVEVQAGKVAAGEREIRASIPMGTRIVGDVLTLLPQVELDPKLTAQVMVSHI